MACLTYKTVIELGSVENRRTRLYDTVLADNIMTYVYACLGRALESRFGDTRCSIDLAIVTHNDIDNLSGIGDLHPITYHAALRTMLVNIVSHHTLEFIPYVLVGGGTHHKSCHLRGK